MAGTAIVSAIIEILLAGLTSMGTGIGQALSGMVTAIMFNGTGETQTLSVFAVVLFVFGGISLAFSLTRWVLNFVTSIGNRNR